MAFTVRAPASRRWSFRASSGSQGTTASPIESDRVRGAGRRTHDQREWFDGRERPTGLGNSTVDIADVVDLVFSSTTTAPHDSVVARNAATAAPERIFNSLGTVALASDSDVRDNRPTNRTPAPPVAGCDD
ncbi:hypothetical protein [Frankia sp. Cj3]|uniref:hypothetical protein n=1 Tax=Frankia sp. Cj3 TaxID=2880976 RepID=UPI001EF66C11|nr:hypothetical protein [Frankia sp. Cj3]